MGDKGYMNGGRRLLRHPSIQASQTYELLDHSLWIIMHLSLIFKSKRRKHLCFLHYPTLINTSSFKRL